MDSLNSAKPSGNVRSTRPAASAKKAPKAAAPKAPVGGKDRVTQSKTLRDGVKPGNNHLGLLNGFRDAYKETPGGASVETKKLGDVGRNGKKLTTAEGILRDQGYSLKEIYSKGKDGKNLVDKFKDANGIKDLRKMQTGQTFGAPGSVLDSKGQRVQQPKEVAPSVDPKTGNVLKQVPETNPEKLNGPVPGQGGFNGLKTGNGPTEIPSGGDGGFHKARTGNGPTEIPSAGDGGFHKARTGNGPTEIPSAGDGGFHKARTGNGPTEIPKGEPKSEPKPAPSSSSDGPTAFA